MQRLQAESRRSLLPFGLAIVAHAVALAMLLAYAPARQALLAAAPIFVEFVVPPKPEIPAPPLEAPRPLKVAPRAIERAMRPAPVVTATPSAPSNILAPDPDPPAPVAPVAVAAPPAPPAPAPAAAETAPVFDADYLDNPAPAYPRLARRNGQQGRVILRVRVNAKGTADDVQVRASSGHEVLDDAARSTVRRWKFVPAKRAGEPVAAWVLIPISFRLDS